MWRISGRISCMILWGEQLLLPSCWKYNSLVYSVQILTPLDIRSKWFESYWKSILKGNSYHDKIKVTWWWANASQLSLSFLWVVESGLLQLNVCKNKLMVLILLMQIRTCLKLQLSLVPIDSIFLYHSLISFSTVPLSNSVSQRRIIHLHKRYKLLHMIHIESSDVECTSASKWESSL